jgi:transposase
MSISIDKRYDIVFLSQHKLGPKLGIGSIAKIIQCSKNTVKYWLKKYKVDKDLTNLKKYGRNRCTTQKEDSNILQIGKREKSVNCTFIQNKINKKGVNISISTITRRLKEHGAKWNYPIVKTLLEKKHRENRLNWANKVIETDWNKVIFTDESSFHINTEPYKTWNFPHEKKVHMKNNIQIKVNCWGCFSSKGFGMIYCFTENLTSELMCEIYKTALIPSASKFFSRSDGWLLQEDNDPKHRSNISKRWKNDNSINMLPWPSYSPDQNPIENVWHILKIKIARKNITTVQGLKSEITKAWNSLPKDLALHLVQSMNKRISNLIERDGDYTLY